MEREKEERKKTTTIGKRLREEKRPQNIVGMLERRHPKGKREKREKGRKERRESSEREKVLKKGRGSGEEVVP